MVTVRGRQGKEEAEMQAGVRQGCLAVSRLVFYGHTQRSHLFGGGSPGITGRPKAGI